jgi:hypothetical protein
MAPPPLGRLSEGSGPAFCGGSDGVEPTDAEREAGATCSNLEFSGGCIALVDIEVSVALAGRSFHSLKRKANLFALTI